MNQIRIEYSDDQINVVDKINKALKQHDLVLVDDDLPQDGYCIFTLQAITKTGSKNGAPSSESNGSHAAKKNPPSVISSQLRDELIRILETGDDKNEGAFTVAIAHHVEKFAVAAREILMTEELAKNDIASLMMMRKQPFGPYASYSGYSGIGNILGDGMGMGTSPIVNNENFGVQAVRQVVDAVRTMGESPAKLVEALVVARENKLDDVVAALEAKLGVAKASVTAAEEVS